MTYPGRLWFHQILFASRQERCPPRRKSRVERLKAKVDHLLTQVTVENQNRFSLCGRWEVARHLERDAVRHHSPAPGANSQSDWPVTTLPVCITDHLRKVINNPCAQGETRGPKFDYRGTLLAPPP